MSGVLLTGGLIAAELTLLLCTTESSTSGACQVMNFERDIFFKDIYSESSQRHQALAHLHPLHPRPQLQQQLQAPQPQPQQQQLHQRSASHLKTIPLGLGMVFAIHYSILQSVDLMVVTVA